MRKYLFLVLAVGFSLVLNACAPGNDVRKAVAERYVAGRVVATAHEEEGFFISNSAVLVCKDNELHIVRVQSDFTGNVDAKKDIVVSAVKCWK